MEEKPRDLRERSFAFAVRVVRLAKSLDDQPVVGRTLTRQLLRSGTSIGANIEEGLASQSRADFVAKYSIACKEARETHYWLRLIAATGVMPVNRLEGLITEANELVAILTTIVRKTRANKAS